MTQATLTNLDLLAKVLHVAMRCFPEAAADKFKAESSLKNDLSANQNTTFDFQLELESTWSIDISDEEMDARDQLGQFAALVEEKLRVIA